MNTIANDWELGKIPKGKEYEVFVYYGDYSEIKYWGKQENRYRVKNNGII